MGFNIILTKVDARCKERCINIVPTLCNVVSTLCNAVLTLCNVENPTLDFVSFSTSDQRYFNVDPQRWNNVDPTLKCWLGSMVLILCLLLCNHDNLILKLHQKKNSYFDKAWIFIGSFKVESVQEMINKEVLAQFIYKTAPTSKLFI